MVSGDDDRLLNDLVNGSFVLHVPFLDDLHDSVFESGIHIANFLEVLSRHDGHGDVSSGLYSG